jgi:hypothetical protein
LVFSGVFILARLKADKENNNYKGTNFFCIFDKKDASKNKVKKVSKTITKQKIGSERLPLQKSSFSLATVPEKCLTGGASHPVGNPKRKV